MNKVIMMGRLTKDPEVRTSGAGKKFARYSLAVDRQYKREGQPDADFFNVSELNEARAGFVEKYLHKGTKVVISGSIQNNNWTDQQGVQHYGVEILEDSVEFAESKKAADNAAAQPAPAPAQAADNAAAQPAPAPAQAAAPQPLPEQPIPPVFS